MTEIGLKLPEGAEEILRTLGKAGFEAYVVGGCVRDALLGKLPHDWDICTAAKPESVAGLFSPERHVIETGLKHGTVTVMMPDGGYEITTFRIDGEYTDHRHPDSVVFTSSLEEDLARRDFTMNAMAYNPETGLCDPFHGREDILMGVIRSVGNPGRRFREDGLRIMRAVRFASVCQYTVEPETERAALSLRQLLDGISAERLQAELVKLLLGDGVEDVLLRYREIIAQIIPELRAAFDFPQQTPWHCTDVYRHLIHSVAVSRKDPSVRLTMLLHDLAKPACRSQKDGDDRFYGHEREGAQMTDGILRRLKFDNTTRETVTELVRLHGMEIPTDAHGVRRVLGRLGERQLSRLLDVKTADAMAQSEADRERKLESIRTVRCLTAELLSEKTPFSLRQLAVNGDDLIALGMKEGEGIGALLQMLLNTVLENPAQNERDILLRKARELAGL